VPPDRNCAAGLGACISLFWRLLQPVRLSGSCGSTQLQKGATGDLLRDGEPELREARRYGRRLSHHPFGETSLFRHDGKRQESCYSPIAVGFQPENIDAGFL
jgi:hypothetical protein